MKSKRKKFKFSERAKRHGIRFWDILQVRTLYYFYSSSSRSAVAIDAMHFRPLRFLRSSIFGRVNLLVINRAITVGFIADALFKRTRNTPHKSLRRVDARRERRVMSVCACGCG